MSAAHAAMPAAARWVVLKFGGSSVASAARWAHIAELVAARRAAGLHVLVVVSALAGVTNALRDLCAAAAPARAGAVAEIAARHEALAAAMGLSGLPPRVATRLTRLAQLVRARPDGAAALHWQAEVMGHGELLSSALGTACLTARGCAAACIDARDWLRAAAPPHHSARARALSAPVSVEPSAEAAARLAALGPVLVAPGFIARDAEGRTVLLGRGGSDTSAACFGALLAAERVETWTDVAGMFSADPRQVPGARLLRHLDYEEAQEIASTGAGVLHPRALAPLREPRVPLWIRDTARPELVGTEIGPRRVMTAPSVKAISSRKGLTLVSMESVGMWQQVGFLAEVFETYRRHGLSVDLIGSAETNVTVSLDPGENLLDSDAVAALATDLAAVCRVKVIAPCAAVTLVGRGMRAMLHRLGAILAEFGQLDVHLISQSSNNLNLTFVVNEEVVDALLPRLHELLLRGGSLRADDGELFGPSWQALYGHGEAAIAPAWWRGERARLLALASERTPRYVYHLATVRARLEALRRLRAVDRFHYAMKANAQPRILQAVAAAGFGIECVSPGELAAAAAATPDAPRLFTPSFAGREEYAAALAAGVAVTLDALHPLRYWGALFRGHEVSLRVDLGRGLGHHEKVRTGGNRSKFGLPLEALDAFLALAREHDVRVRELHAHLGSGILDAGHWADVYAQLASLADRIGGIDTLNIGGGLGVPAHPGEQPLDLAALDRLLLEVKHAYPQFQLAMEPGRFIVAEAGVLLARVTQEKRKGERRYLGVDAGMHVLLRPALYDAWHHIVNLTRLDAPPGALYQVVGPICETGDVLGSDRRLPESREGDVLLIAEAGAYGAVMASGYNLREPADEVILA